MYLNTDRVHSVSGQGKIVFLRIYISTTRLWSWSLLSEKYWEKWCYIIIKHWCAETDHQTTVFMCKKNPRHATGNMHHRRTWYPHTPLVQLLIVNEKGFHFICSSWFPLWLMGSWYIHLGAFLLALLSCSYLLGRSFPMRHCKQCFWWVLY